MDLFCYLCFTFVFIILSCLFLAALLSPTGKVITCWKRPVLFVLLCAMFSCVLSLSHMVSWGSGVVFDCIDS